MSINDIFSKRRRGWAKLEKARKPAKKKQLRIAHKRIEQLCDDKSFKEMFTRLRTADPIKFPGYMEKIAELDQNGNATEAFVAGTAKIHRIKVAIGVSDPGFMMGSMGTVVGEKIASLAEYAAKKRLPLIIFSASGGARMQEGMFSLMQMVKTAQAVERYRAAGGLFISCLTHPTTGGVSASYATLGDIILAEPGALIGFAGPRVIEQTIGEKLPEGFQRSEFLLEHGMIDMIVEQAAMRETIYKLLKLHEGGMFCER